MAEADLIDSEQRYRSLLAAAPDLVVRFEANGDCYAANHPSWLPREGVEPVLEALRWSWQGAGRAVLNDAEQRTVELTVRAIDDDQHLLCRLVAEHSDDRSAGPTYELQSLMRISYAVFHFY